MARVLILVEGPTEERFIKDRLVQPLAQKGIYLLPSILNTKIIKSGPNFKGGVSSYGQIKRDLKNMLKDLNADCITTMLDLYGLPDDFPGYEHRALMDCHEKVNRIEEACREDINDQRFHPYLQLHEFEALLFSKPDEIASRFENETELLARLRDILRLFNNPEEINDNPETCPSKRLIALEPSYRKVLYGPLIAGNIGLEKIRSECSHFDEWVNMLESFEQI